MSKTLTDRQTDRRIPYAQFYRKLRGIGEYSKRTDGQQAGWSKSETSNNVGMADKRHEESDKGEYP